MERIKFTFSNRVYKYKELLDEIRQANRDLRDVTHQNIALEPRKHERRSKRPVTILKLIRKHAAGLYRVLIADRNLKCTCKMYHMASLRLEARPQKTEEVRADIQKYTFRILLSVVDDAGTIPNSRWAEIEVIPSSDNQALAGNIGKTALSQPVCSVGQRPKVKAVKFAPEGDSFLAKPRDNEVSAVADRKYIEEFCSLMCAPDDIHKEIGFLMDEGIDKFQYKLERADTVVESDCFSKSLGEILKGAHKHAPNKGLLRRDRLQIAVTLASSVLQLDGTSWLKSQWSTYDILFHCKKSHGGGIEYSSPYLAWQRCCDGNITALERLSLDSHMIRSEVLLALGFALIELCFSRTLADMWKPEDTESNEMMTRLKTAIRLHGSIYPKMGVPYGEVVRRCLYQPFDVRDLSFDNDDVQQKVFDDIVTPLTNNLRNFDGY